MIANPDRLEIMKTEFYKALDKYGMIVDDVDAAEKELEAQNQAAAQAQAAAQTQQAAPNAKAPAGKGVYASSGSHLKDVDNGVIISSKTILPGEKISKKNGRIMCVLGQENGKNGKIYIKPFDFDHYTGNVIKLWSGFAKEVKYGDPHFSQACLLYLTSSDDADAFLANCQRKYPNANLALASTPVDKNGYFRVSTDCGEAWIRASRLNEDLTLREDAEIEDLKEREDEPSRIGNIDVYDEWFHDSIS